MKDSDKEGNLPSFGSEGRSVAVHLGKLQRVMEDNKVRNSRREKESTRMWRRRGEEKEEKLGFFLEEGEESRSTTTPSRV